jgi:hypothetical protein
MPIWQGEGERRALGRLARDQIWPPCSSTNFLASVNLSPLHLTITIAGGCHVPFPAGKIDGGVAFGQ